MIKKFSNKFDQLIDFLNFTNEFREVIRVARVPHGKRCENDVEHSYQLAMMAWFLIEQDKLGLNKELCFLYALSHDLVEIYAGDTYAFDKKSHNSKEDREKEALGKIIQRFPNFEGLTDVIKNYEKMKDEESKFIYALDKIIPTLQIYQEDGKSWQEHNVSFKDLLDYKSKKISIAPDVDKYWQELLKELSSNKQKFFLK